MVSIRTLSMLSVGAIVQAKLKAGVRSVRSIGVKDDGKREDTERDVTGASRHSSASSRVDAPSAPDSHRSLMMSPAESMQNN